MLAQAIYNQTVYDEAMTITIDNLYTAFDEVEEKYFLASDCVDEWYKSEIEANGYMAQIVSMGSAYDAIYFELLEGEGITLSESSFLAYELAFL